MTTQPFQSLVGKLTNELLGDEEMVAYRDLITLPIPAALKNTLKERAERLVTAEFERIFQLEHFDDALLDPDDLQLVRELLTHALVVPRHEIEDATKDSVGKFAESWNAQPIDMRLLENDPKGFAAMIFDRANTMGFGHGDLEPKLIATVFELSDAEILADVVRLEETINPELMNIDALSLALERFNLLRKEYVVARRMASGGHLDIIAKPAETVGEQSPVMAPVMTPVVPEVLLSDDPFGLGTPAPAPKAPPAPAVAPVRPDIPTAKLATPEPPSPPVAPKIEEAHGKGVDVTVPIREVITVHRPDHIKAPDENRYELLDSWRTTFMNPKTMDALMGSLRTKNETGYKQWVERVCAQSQWSAARIYIDNYLFVYGVERGTVLWERVMKTSVPFFPDAPPM